MAPDALRDFRLRENDRFDLAPHSMTRLSGIGGSAIAAVHVVVGVILTHARNGCLRMMEREKA
jgi:hypothetical protein